MTKTGLFNYLIILSRLFAKRGLHLSANWVRVVERYLFGSIFLISVTPWFLNCKSSLRKHTKLDLFQS